MAGVIQRRPKLRYFEGSAPGNMELLVNSIEQRSRPLGWDLSRSDPEPIKSIHLHGTHMDLRHVARLRAVV